MGSSTINSQKYQDLNSKHSSLINTNNQKDNLNKNENQTLLDKNNEYLNTNEDANPEKEELFNISEDEGENNLPQRTDQSNEINLTESNENTYTNNINKIMKRYHEKSSSTSQKTLTSVIKLLQKGKNKYLNNENDNNLM